MTTPEQLAACDAYAEKLYKEIYHLGHLEALIHNEEELSKEAIELAFDLQEGNVGVDEAEERYQEMDFALRTRRS